MLGCSSGVMRAVDPATSDEPVVTATYCLPPAANVTGKPLTGAPRLIFPQHLAGLVVERLEAAVGVAAEHEPAAGGDERQHAGALFVLPQRLAGLGGDRPHAADVVVAPGAITPGMSSPYTFDGSRVSTVVLAFMHMFCSGMYIALVFGLYAPAGQFLPPLLPGQISFVSSFCRPDRLRIHRHLAGGAVDVADDVLHHRRPRPQELAGAAIERVDDAGLAGNAGDHLALLARLDLRIDPRRLPSRQARSPFRRACARTDDRDPSCR